MFLNHLHELLLPREVIHTAILLLIFLSQSFSNQTFPRIWWDILKTTPVPRWLFVYRGFWPGIKSGSLTDTGTSFWGECDGKLLSLTDWVRKSWEVFWKLFPNQTLHPKLWLALNNHPIQKGGWIFPTKIMKNSAKKSRCFFFWGDFQNSPFRCATNIQLRFKIKIFDWFLHLPEKFKFNSQKDP